MLWNTFHNDLASYIFGNVFLSLLNF